MAAIQWVEDTMDSISAKTVDTKPLLFQPIALGRVTLPNRIVISPMCQYAATDGNAGNWHLIHLGHLALSGAGLLMIEATAVEPAGRISRECLGIYSDANEAALAGVLAALREHSAMPIGIQLSHAGRKASRQKPADGRGPVTEEDGGWQTVGPSPVAFAENWNIPTELSRSDMDGIVASFVAAARRCARLPIDVLEIHAAHGYLLSSFLSPLANRRTDAYGGSLANRMRFPLEVIAAVRDNWPSERALGVRLNGTDWIPGGATIDDAVEFARQIRLLKADFVDVSSGGNAFEPIPSRPGYQVPFAAKIRQNVDIPVMTVGRIRTPKHAEAILQRGEADMIAIGRGFLNDPRWPWHAAEYFKTGISVPPQYMRAATRSGLPSAFSRAG